MFWLCLDLSYDSWRVAPSFLFATVAPLSEDNRHLKVGAAPQSVLCWTFSCLRRNWFFDVLRIRSDVRPCHQSACTFLLNGWTETRGRKVKRRESDYCNYLTLYIYTYVLNTCHRRKPSRHKSAVPKLLKPKLSGKAVASRRDAQNSAKLERVKNIISMFNRAPSSTSESIADDTKDEDDDDDFDVVEPKQFDTV